MGFIALFVSLLLATSAFGATYDQLVQSNLNVTDGSITYLFQTEDEYSCGEFCAEFGTGCLDILHSSDNELTANRLVNEILYLDSLTVELDEDVACAYLLGVEFVPTTTTTSTTLTAPNTTVTTTTASNATTSTTSTVTTTTTTSLGSWLYATPSIQKCAAACPARVGRSYAMCRCETVTHVEFSTENGNTGSSKSTTVLPVVAVIIFVVGIAILVNVLKRTKVNIDMKNTQLFNDDDNDSPRANLINTQV